MNGKNLFRALEYVDDRYLDMVDAALQEATDMKQKHFSGRKTILYILAAAICVSLLTVTAAAAGWIPNIFAAAQPKATPRDEPVLEAAQSATQSQTPETVEFAEVPYQAATAAQHIQAHQLRVILMLPKPAENAVYILGSGLPDGAQIPGRNVRGSFP